MKRAFNEFKQGQNVQKPTADEPSLKRTKINLDVDHDHTSQTILLQMIVFLQRYYVTTTETNTTYQALFREFIAHKRKHALPALDLVSWDSMTFETHGAVVREAVHVAFCHVLSSYDDPVNIVQKCNASNVTNAAKYDVNPSVYPLKHDRVPSSTKTAMNTRRAPNAKKPFVRRIRLFHSRSNKKRAISKDALVGASGHKKRHPLHKNHKSDEIVGASGQLQTLNKPSPNNYKNTKKRATAVSTGSTNTDVVMPSTVSITST
eukprot:52978_1